MSSYPRELRTERLLLRQWRPEDAEALHEIYRQPEFLAHMIPLDLDQTRAQIEKFVTRWDTEGVSHWAAEDLASHRLIGRIGLQRHHDWPLAPSPSEVGWTLHRDFHGRGLATEGGAAAVAAWREHLPGDAQLLSITRPRNLASRSVMERLGFTLRGETFWHESEVVWYALDR